MSIQEMLTSTTQLGAAISVTKDELLKPLGVIFVRVGLWATGKGKSGIEKTEYSLEEIKQIFLLEAGTIVGHTVMYPPWTPVLVATEAGVVVGPAPSAGPHQSVTSCNFERRFFGGQVCV